MINNKYNDHPYIRLLSLCFFFFLSVYLQINTDNYVAKLMLSAFLGFLVAGGLNLSHECLHRNYIENRVVNDSIGVISALLLFINFYLYKDFHLQHHAYLGTSEDTETRNDFRTLKEYMITLSGINLAKKKISSNVLILCGVFPSYIKTKNKRKIVINSLLSLLLFIMLIIWTYLYLIPLFFAYWLSLFFGYAFVVFFGLPEHHRCEKINGYYCFARSIESNRLIRFFLWDSNYHAEHHIYPGISSSKLNSIPNLKSKIYYYDKSYIGWHKKVITSLIKKCTQNV